MVDPRRDVYTTYSTVEGYGSPPRMPSESLRANNSMSFREFIAVVKFLWENLHPDIPIMPTQGPQFAQYPVITYSIELRRSHQTEPKYRFREEIVSEEGEIYHIWGRRFQDLIAFSVHTHNDPLMAEQIIEEFEVFMDTYVGVLKENGASEIVFSRRMSDREENRTSQDTSIRTSVYLVTLERVKFVRHDKLAKITVNVRNFLNFQRSPSFEVTTAQIGTDEITLLHHNAIVNVGDEILLRSIDNSHFTFPLGISDSHKFVVYEVGTFADATPSLITLKIRKENGVAISFVSGGKGWWQHSVEDNYSIILPDILAIGATPSP